jgi:hypothetical protein
MFPVTAHRNVVKGRYLIDLERVGAQAYLMPLS